MFWRRMIRVQLEAVEPMELIRKPSAVFVRVVRETGYWPIVELYGKRDDVREFVRSNWGGELEEYAVAEQSSS